MALHFRTATEQDVPFLAEVLLLAGRGHLPRGPWDLAFPEAVERVRALELLAGEAPRSWCHRSVFEIAAVDGEAAAAMVVFESDELGDALAKSLFDVLQPLDWSPERKAAIGPLLGRALQSGRVRGFARAQISCLIGNDAAQRAYEKVGFAVVEELRDADFEAMLGAPGFSRMTLAL